MHNVIPFVTVVTAAAEKIWHRDKLNAYFRNNKLEHIQAIVKWTRLKII
jgi:hypothetical protein